MRSAFLLSSLFALACLSLSLSAAAETPPVSADLARVAAPKDIRDEVPLVGYTHSAFGASPRTAGLAGFAGANGGGQGVDSTQIGGGARVWGSPIDRLTLFIEVERAYYNKIAPSGTVLFRVLGDRARGWAVGAAASYRSEAFSELEGEIEMSALLSVAKGGWHADTNFVVGTGIEEREVDGEWKVRVGYDPTSWLRVGLDGRGRYRLAGDRALPGGRLGDFIGGPEILIGVKSFFIGASTGPSTVGIADGWGWHATATMGGALL